MGYFKTQLIEQQEAELFNDVSDIEVIWLQDEIEQALDDGDIDRAAQLMSQLDITIQQEDTVMDGRKEYFEMLYWSEIEEQRQSLEHRIEAAILSGDIEWRNRLFEQLDKLPTK